MSNRRSPVRPLPGSRPAAAKGMHPYVINLSDATSQESTNRRSAVDHYTQMTGHFLRDLGAELQRKHLADQVAQIGPPSPFPVVTLTCTPAVAEIIESMAGVSEVYRDDEPSMGFVE